MPVFIRFFLFVFVMSMLGTLQANERHSDPDGCLSCHALEGLQFIDDEGLLRVSTIDASHYYSSLHGSVPCKDCHRKITYYPHEVENGYVDCAESCHVNEPSTGEAYTHKPIVEEFQKSTHGKGLIKDFAGGNRLQEELDELNPSCRRCHANTAYILPEQMKKFKTEFMHTETECGTCHQGEAWRDQFGGHILRRLIGSRWKKQENNKFCVDCHGNHKKMARVELEDPKTQEKKNVSNRWIYATESYERSLHSRLLKTNIEEGASCMDCHAPTTKGEFRHDIRRDEDELSSTHSKNLAETCAESGCHEFTLSAMNSGFVETDLHDSDQIKIREWQALFDENSPWKWASYFLILFICVFLGGCIVWLFKGIKEKRQTPILGSDSFERIMIGRKTRRKTKKRVVKKKVTPPIKKAPEKQDEVITSSVKKLPPKEQDEEGTPPS
jgi:sulfite reductase (NADPH) flavoprotein alpha-component